MTYKNTQELIEILKKHKLWAKKKLGQNFLVNNSVIRKIIKAANLSKKDNVIEVGPGLGILTKALAEHSGKVRSIELDPNLITILKQELSSFKNIEFEKGNALKAALPAKQYKLVANIPYYITSPLLTHFLQPQKPREKRPSLIVLLVQKEVAEKICAKDGGHSVLSLQVQIFGKPSICGKVPANNFYPKPKVDSAILKIETYDKPLIDNTELFFKIIKTAFGQRRKTLQNSLQNLKIPKEQIQTLLEKSKIDPQKRPQMLSIHEWENLTFEVEGLSGMIRIA